MFALNSMKYHHWIYIICFFFFIFASLFEANVFRKNEKIWDTNENSSYISMREFTTELQPTIINKLKEGSSYIILHLFLCFLLLYYITFHRFQCSYAWKSFHALHTLHYYYMKMLCVTLNSSHFIWEVFSLYYSYLLICFPRVSF